MTWRFQFLSHKNCFPKAYKYVWCALPRVPIILGLVYHDPILPRYVFCMQPINSDIGFLHIFGNAFSLSLLHPQLVQL